MKVKNNAMNNMAKLNSTQAKNKIDAFAKNKANKTNNSTSVGGSAKLQLSERAQRMKTARNIASDTSIDHAKVDRLQKLIDQGQYKVDAASVADRMVDSHLIFGD